MSDQLTGFAIIPADLARTPAVTAQAKAAYAALTSHRGEKTILLRDLAKEVGTTPEATQKALRSLYDRGWGELLTRIAPRVIEEDPR
ncbi:MAG: hypothetical protein ACTHU7_14250 [Microbacterium sp.]